MDKAEQLRKCKQSNDGFVLLLVCHVTKKFQWDETYVTLWYGLNLCHLP